MPTPAELRARLIRKLTELFQLNQPDLDFGFYRIMHAKAREVLEFIDQDLMSAVVDAFSTVDEARVAEKQLAYEKAYQMALDFGALKPEEAPAVKRAKVALEAVKNNAANEADVYDHLYRFFERYYDDGDFISRRYYSRETPGKAAPFAVPYNGEEVKLHWANADQYYIKTAEYFSNFSFDLRQAKEVRDSLGGLALGDDATPLRVHFRVVEATEGEHGNSKESEASKRFFIIHAANPVRLNEAGELEVNFEYRPDPEKTGQEKGWRERRNAEAAATILGQLARMAQARDEHEWRLDEYIHLLTIPAPTENDPQRPLLARYIAQFTARNTMDYFIHKDLGGFLRRELDFYIKNEVMHLDDIENAEAPAVETYLAKVRVMRRIAGKLIDFLAQLEEFQRKLWLKKKFVVETNYLVSLDMVPIELLPEIFANQKQRSEWQQLLNLRIADQESACLTQELLEKNKNLVVDTAHFPDEFRDKLISKFNDFDSCCTGLFLASDNFQALSFLYQYLYMQVKCIYIDPPYNTSASAILYKNDYKHSSWCTMMRDRLSLARHTLKPDGAIFVSIDKAERTILEHALDQVFGEDNHIEELIWTQATANGQLPNYSTNHEYVEVYARSRAHVERDADMFREPKPGYSEIMDLVESIRPDYPPTDKIEAEIKKLFQEHIIRYKSELELEGKEYDSEAKRQDPWRGIYPYNRAEYRDKLGRLVSGEIARLSDASIWIWSEISAAAPASKQSPTTKDPKNFNYRYYRPRHPVTGKLCAHPRSGWKFPYEPDPNNPSRRSFSFLDQDNRIVWGEDESKLPRTKGFLHEVETNIGTSVFYEYNDGENELTEMFGKSGLFLSPKSSRFVKKFIVQATKKNDWVVDFFGGSGSTGHAVLAQNREDTGIRKTLLVEIGHHFDTLLIPRMKKAVFSSSWKNGEPVAGAGARKKLMKYLRLESYEDTLNNLRMEDNPMRRHAINADASLKEDYMLHYLLDVETQGSQSLLNIDQFVDPTAYTLKVKKPGTDEICNRTVDLIETFNYLIGLRVGRYAEPRTFNADFKRVPDPELPGDQRTKLVVEGEIRPDPAGPWWFRQVEGWVPRDPDNPNNGERDQILIVWRKLTGDLERDNAVLDAWFQSNRFNHPDFQCDTVYVNGSSNLPNLRLKGDTWKVRLTEEEFMNRMWEVDA